MFLGVVAIVWLVTNILNPSLVPVSGPVGMWVAGSMPFVLLGLLFWIASVRGWRFALFSLVPAVLIVLSLEGAFRAYYYLVADSRQKLFLSAPRTRRLGRGHVYAPHHYALYGLNPDFVTEEGTRHNSLGFRDERDLAPDDQAIRIVFLGGSTTYTIRLRDNRKIFSSGLEQELNSRFGDRLGDRRIEVINAGLGGSTSAENLIRLAFFVSEVNPDLVVIQHGLNDVRPRLTGTIRTDYGNYRKSWEAPSPFDSRNSIAYGVTVSLAQTTMLGNFIAHATRLTKARQVGAYTTRPHEGDPAENLERNEARYFARNTRYMVGLAREMGARVLLVTAPFTDELDAIHAKGAAEHNRILRAIAAEKDVLLFDLAAEMTLDDLHLPDAVHVSQEGSDLKRDLYLRYLVDNQVVEELIARHGRDGQ